MSKDLCELTLIRLQTELENAIGFREHYLTLQDWNLFNMWDIEVDHIIDELIMLGDSYEG
jgi:hypothetical protein